MDSALQKYYEDRLTMMSTPAWKELMTDVESMIKTTDTLSGVVDERTLNYRRGELSIMRWLLSLRDVSDKSYEELKNANNS